MKKTILTLLAALAVTVAGHAQETLSDAQAKEIAPGIKPDTKLLKVATLHSVEANQEFQRNVQVMQAMRQRAVKLREDIDAATDEGKKAELETELEELVQQLNDNNQKMVEAYGFSLTRNYIMVIEKSHIYMAVSEEEAEKIKQDQAADANAEASE